MVSPFSRRRAAKHIVEKGLGSASRVCRAFGLGRSSFYQKELVSKATRQLESRVIALSEQHPRYGYRFITALLRAEGYCVNAKRVQRVRRRAGLRVRKKQRRTRRPEITAL